MFSLIFMKEWTVFIYTYIHVWYNSSEAQLLSLITLKLIASDCCGEKNTPVFKGEKHEMLYFVT